VGESTLQSVFYDVIGAGDYVSASPIACILFISPPSPSVSYNLTSFSHPIFTTSCGHDPVSILAAARDPFLTAHNVRNRRVCGTSCTGVRFRTVKHSGMAQGQIESVD